MLSFNVGQFGDAKLKPCICEDDPKNLEKSFCYVEGTKVDTSRSDTKQELGENVWYEAKPPKLFTKNATPLVSARQIQILRVVLGGKRGGAALLEKPKEKVVINMKKKRSAVKFLSTTKIN